MHTAEEEANHQQARGQEGQEVTLPGHRTRHPGSVTTRPTCNAVHVNPFSADFFYGIVQIIYQFSQFIVYTDAIGVIFSKSLIF